MNHGIYEVLDVKKTGKKMTGIIKTAVSFPQFPRTIIAARVLYGKAGERYRNCLFVRLYWKSNVTNERR